MRYPYSFKVLLTIFLFGIASFVVFQPISYAESEANSNNKKDIFDVGKPSLSNFTSDDGLPVNAIMSLERDNRGFIWFGTQDGATVFNGYDFTVVDMPNRTVSNYIHDVMAAKDGSIWFATGTGGVQQLKDGAWKTFDEENRLISNNARVIYEHFNESDEQTIWIGTTGGLSKLVGEVITNYTVKEGLPDRRVRSIIVTTDESEEQESVWIGTYGGLAVWRGNEKKVYNEENGLPGNIVFKLLETRNKNGELEIWAGTNKGVARFSAGKWETFEDISESLSKTVRGIGKTLKADGTETIWFGFDGAGLAYFEEGKWSFLKEENGLPNDLVFGFAPTGAEDGSVWISNLGKGVSRFERSNWRSFNRNHGLKNDIVFSMEESISKDNKKEIWFGTFGGGLTRFSDGVWKTFDKSNGLISDFVLSILPTEEANGEKNLFVGFETGLMSYQNGNWKNIDLGGVGKQFEIWDIKESVDNTGEKRLLIATNEGLIIKEKDSEKRVLEGEGVSNNNLRGVTETISKDGERTIWMSTYSAGLAKYKDDKVTIFNKSNGLLTDRIYSANEIKFGNSRQLWLGTGGGGIAILDLEKEEEKFQIINTENSNLIPSDTVYKIFQDSQERIYVTTNKGVARITPNESNEILGFDSYFFTTQDGLLNNECTSAAGFIDSANRVWVGTTDGASVLDLSKEFKDEKAEPLFLQNVLIDGDKIDLKPDAELAYNENNLTFEYVMPTNFRESATLYRTQMIGLEENPTDWTKEPRREFTFIPSGDFTFKVWGKDASGNISLPLEIPFTIRPAWWVSWWAIMLYFLATILIVSLIAYIIYSYRLQRMLEIERVRTRIATDLHDDVGSSLSKISILSEVLAQNGNGFKKDEKESLATIADTSREVVGSMSDMVWSINPNRDNLQDTVRRMRRFANEVLGAKNVNFTFDVPTDEREIKLDVDLRRQLYLVFKESINNCAKYSECDRVEISLKRKTDGIYLKISDNGKGFDINQLERGNGLENMKKRADEVGGKFNITSEVGKGTTILLKLPRRLAGFAFPKTT